MSHLRTYTKLITLIFFSIFLFLFKFSYGQSSPEERKIGMEATAQPVKPLPELRIGAQMGYGYRFERSINSVFPEIKKYSSKLKNALSYGTDITYYFSKYMGIGVKFNGIHSEAKMSKKFFISMPYDDIIARTSEKIDMQYIGAFYAVRYFITPYKHCIFLNAGVGYNRYRNNLQNFHPFGDISETITENTLALSAEIGYDFLVTKFLAIGLQVSTSFGLLKEHINVGYVDLSLGLRFWK